MSTYFKNTYLIKLLLKYKWHLSIILIIAIAASAIFSGPKFIKPKYKSFAVIYPVNLTPYSSETQTEQLLQLLKSEDILFEIVKKFNLYKEYDIDTTKKYYRTKMLNKLKDYINVRRTEYESVVIEIYDNSPVQACEMVKEYINLMNLKARYLQRSKTAEIVKIYYDQLAYKQKQIDSIEKRLNELRQNYNILDYNIQVEEYSKGFVNYIVKHNTSKNEEINTTLNNMKLYGGEFRILDANLWGLIESYVAIKKEYDKSLSDMTKELTYANVVTQPVVADKKSYPIRWLIVSITTVSAFLLSLILFSVIESIKNSMKKQQ